MTSNVAPLLVICNSPSMSIRSSPASTPVSVCTPVMGDSFTNSLAEMSAVRLDPRRMAKLGEELVVVVAADDVMRHRDANRGRGLDRSACGPGISFSKRARMTGRILPSWAMTTSGSMSTSRTPEYDCWYSTMNRSAASSFSVPRRPAVARLMPLSNISRSKTPNASSSSPLEANQRYSVGRETPACSATSERLSFVCPLRPSTSAVATRIRCLVEVSSTPPAASRSGSFTSKTSIVWSR